MLNDLTSEVVLHDSEPTEVVLHDSEPMEVVLHDSESKSSSMTPDVK